MRIFLALCFSTISNGRILFQQRGGSNNYMTQVQVGTPPQTMDVSASFGYPDMRLLDETTQFPFLPSFNSGKSTSFREGTDTLRFSDGHEIPEMSILPLDFIGHSHMDRVRYDTGLAGFLGLSQDSRIASKFTMRFKSCPLSISDKIVPGFTLDLEEPDVAPDVPAGVVEIAAPVKSDHRWAIDSSLSINGQRLFSGRNIHFEFDLSVDVIRLSRTVISELYRTLRSQNFNIRTHLSSGLLELKFPCDEEHMITTKQWIDFKLVLEDGNQVTINIPILGVGPRDGMGYCISVIQAERSGDRNIIGNLVLENRHSVIFDKLKNQIRFMDYYPLVPLNAALPPVPGFPAPIVVSHSIHPVVDDMGLVRFVPTESDGGYVLRSLDPLRIAMPGVMEYIQYEFFGSTLVTLGQQSQFVVPGLFHVDDSLPLTARLDYETHQIVLPTRIATDVSIPVYEINVEVNRMSMLVRLERVEAIADFDLLDIVIKDEEQIDECCICYTTKSENEDDSVSVVNPCEHRFHTNCLRGWIDRKANCPVCRCQIRMKPNGSLRRRVDN